jgi:hypothetical protein
MRGTARWYKLDQKTDRSKSPNGSAMMRWYCTGTSMVGWQAGIGHAGSAARRLASGSAAAPAQRRENDTSVVLEYSGVASVTPPARQIINRALDVRSLHALHDAAGVPVVTTDTNDVERCAAFLPPAMGLAGASGQPGRQTVARRQASAHMRVVAGSPARPAGRTTSASGAGRAVTQHGWAAAVRMVRARRHHHARRGLRQAQRHNGWTLPHMPITSPDFRPLCCSIGGNAIDQRPSRQRSQRRSVHREMTAGLPV